MVAKHQSISILYKARIEEDSTFTLRGTNGGDEAVTIMVNEAQITFQIYDEDYPLTNINTTCP